MRYRYTVVLERDPDSGAYLVRVPALPGCVSEGDDPLEALEMAREALEGYHAALAALGRSPPQPSPFLRVEAAPRQEARVGRVEWATGPHVLEHPVYSAGELRRALEREGLRLVRREARHLYLASPDGARLVALPTREATVKPPVVRALLAHLGLREARLRPGRREQPPSPRPAGE